MTVLSRLFTISALAAVLFCLSNTVSASAITNPFSHLHHVGRMTGGHKVIANKKRNAISRRNSKRCRVPSTTSSQPAANTTPHTTTTTTTSTHKPTKSPSSDGGNNGHPGSTDLSSGPKLGLAWADGDASYLNNLQGLKWIYTWGVFCPPTAQKLGMSCLPQLWGEKNQQEFDSMAGSSDAPLFLGMNEVNEAGQANLSVDEGIAMWKASMKPLRDQGKKCCSPVTSSNPNGLVWLKSFIEKCPECDWDVTCVHWYDTTFEKFQTYVELWHDTFGKDVMVTEYAAQNFNGGDQPSPQEVSSFFSQAVPWLESQPWVLAHMPFGFMKPPTSINPADNMLNDDGSLTGLGSMVFSQGK